MTAPFSWRGGNLRIAVRVQPKASRNRVAGLHGEGRVKITLTAPPVEGAANKALITFLAKAFKVPRGRVTLLKGESSREKLLEIDAPDPAQVSAMVDAWGLSLPD